MTTHRDSAKNEKSNMKLHSHMRTIGIEHFKIELIESFHCENVKQLRAREGEHIRNLKPELNQNIAGRNHNDSQKEYYQNNRDSILSRQNKKNECPCGGRYSNSQKALHFRSNIHIKFENEIKQNQSEHYILKNLFFCFIIFKKHNHNESKFKFGIHSTSEPRS